jgi:hypothetical protein
VVVGCSLRWPIMQFGNSGGKNEYRIELTIIILGRYYGGYIDEL